MTNNDKAALKEILDMHVKLNRYFADIDEDEFEARMEWDESMQLLHDMYVATSKAYFTLSANSK